MWVLLLMLLMTADAFAASATLKWTPNAETDVVGYRIYSGNMPCSAPGPMLPAASVGAVNTAPLTVPDGSTVVSARISAVDAAGNESTQSVCVEKTFVVVNADVEKLKAQVAGICRAAKAMGGTSTSLAGRLRKEIPCL